MAENDWRNQAKQSLPNEYLTHGNEKLLDNKKETKKGCRHHARAE